MDTAVSAVAAVVGSGAVDFHVSLSAMDVRADPNPNSNLNPNPNPNPNPDPKPNPNPTPNQVSLSAMDVQYAFVVAQGGGTHVHGGEEGAETIGFDEFATCVALCGHPNPSPNPNPNPNPNQVRRAVRLRQVRDSRADEPGAARGRYPLPIDLDSPCTLMAHPATRRAPPCNPTC